LHVVEAPEIKVPADRAFIGKIAPLESVVDDHNFGRFDFVGE
jgi:hypothetical protein